MLVAACSGAPPAARAPDSAELSAVYAAVIDSLRGVAPTVVVERRYTVDRQAPAERRRTYEWVVGQDSRYSMELLSALDSAREGEAILATAVATHPGVTLADSLLAGRHATPSLPTIGLSQIGISRDHSHAVVLARMFCGPRCGLTGYFLLRRTRDGRWQMIGKVVTVVS